MRRRTVVVGTATALSVAVAGCTTATGSRRLSIEPFDPAHVAYAVADLTPEQEAALDTIREDGTDVTYGIRRFNDPGDKGYVALEDGFYRVRTSQTGERVLRRDLLLAERDGSEEAAESAIAVQEAYGDDDRQRIYRAAESVLERGGSGFSSYVFRGVGYDTTDLLPEPAHEFVELEPEWPWNRRQILRLRVVSSGIPEPEYTTRLEHVGDAEDDLVRHLDHAGLVSPLEGSQLTAKQRDVVETAIDDGVYGERRAVVDDDPFDGLELEPRHDPETNRPYRILRYDDEYYTWSVTRTDGVL